MHVVGDFIAPLQLLHEVVDGLLVLQEPYWCIADTSQFKGGINNFSFHFSVDSQCGQHCIVEDDRQPVTLFDRK